MISHDQLFVTHTVRGFAYALGSAPGLGVLEHGWDDAQSAARRGKTGRNPKDRGKSGVKRGMLMEGHGVPVGLAVDGANRHGLKVVREIIERSGPFPISAVHLQPRDAV